jgi:hypothetical protein
VSSDVREAERAALADQQAEHAVPGRQFTDECSFLVGDPFGDELLDATVGREDADRTVSSLRQIDRELHDASQNGLQRSLGGERQPSLDEELGTISALDPVRHVRSLAFDVSPGTVVRADGPIIEGPLALIDRM